MTFNPDDPKYTAYVLDELSDADRAAIEAEMLTNPEASALVREIRATTNELSAAFKAERLPELTAAQREAVLAAPTTQPAATPSNPATPELTRRPLWAAALAASLLLAAGAGWLLRGLNLQSERESARLHGIDGTSNAAILNPRDGESSEALSTTTELRDDIAAVVVQGNATIDERIAVPTRSLDERESSSRRAPIAPSNSLRFAVASPGVNGTDARVPLPSNYSLGTSVSGASTSPVDSYSIDQPGQNVSNNRAVSVNNLKQLSSGSTSIRTSSAGTMGNAGEAANPASRFGGGVDPSELVGLDPKGRAPAQHDFQFRQGGFGAAIPPFGGFDASSARGLPAPQPTGSAASPASLSSATNPATHSNGGPVAFKEDGNVRLYYGAQDRLATTTLSADKEKSVEQLMAGDKIVSELAKKTEDVQSVIATLAANDPGVARLKNQVKGLEERLERRRTELRPQIIAHLQNTVAPTLEHEHNTEAYDSISDNPFLAAVENPLSTFSIDVDTASYSNVRRFLTQNNQLPPPGAVRIEELVNYFRYDYPQPKDDKPFSVTTEVASCPWAAEHRLVRIGLKGREIDADKRPLTNLVFLIDVSGSMQPANKLPLVRESLKMLTEKLGENDTVAIVVYAGSSGLVLPSTRGDQRSKIIDAIDRLSADGSTNGAQGIELAYEIASQNFVKGGVNRVILATDGDFNVGVTSQDQLVKLIEEKAKTGVFLTALGFGYGNIKDSTLEKLADKGNGNYAYIDDLPEARKVLVEQIGGTLVTIAKDVKIQVEFNPLEVAGYRLIGYENRLLAKEDFNNDKKDAGEIGAGHTVTALYEILPVKKNATEAAEKKSDEIETAAAETKDQPAVDPLRYIQPAALTEAAKQGELFTLKLRYKQPDGDKSTLMETPVKDAGKKYGEASRDFQFAAAVASFGLILRDSPHKGNATLAAVEELAKTGLESAGKTSDSAYRAEFIELVKQAKTLKGPQ